MPSEFVADADLEDITEEKLISVLSHRPRRILRGMIQSTESAKLPSDLRPSSPCSLGDLDSLSLELLHSIFAMLDFKTLSDISKTCLRGVLIVESVPQYRDVVLHAPQAVVALARTRLIRYHCAATVHAALLSADCASCGRYGAFLFLPTCQRCCNHCLWRNQSLWVIPISVAQKCFGFSAAGAKTLPIMRCVPGTYHVRHTVSRKRPVRLVCVGAAKKLALAESRSEECMRRDLDAKPRSSLSEKEYYLQNFLQQAHLTPPGPEFAVQPTESNVPNDMFCGMASVPFPYVVPHSHVEHGLWCLGCEAYWRRWSPNNPIPDHLYHLIARGCRAADIIYNMQDVARSRSDFLKHIRECPGTKEVFLAAKEHQDDG